MKKTFIITFLLLLTNSLYAQDRTLTFFGDSRAVGFSMAEGCQCSPYHSIDECREYIETNGCGFKVVSRAVDDDGVRILADGAITGIKNLGKGGLTALLVKDFLQVYNGGYKSHVTHISLGGNDLLQFLSLFAVKVRKNGYRHNPWDWDFEVVTDHVTSYIEVLLKYILEKDSTNKVVLNDVAPVLASTYIPDIADINNISWDLFSLLNNKYRNLVAGLGERAQFLETFQEFKDNLTGCSRDDAATCMLLCWANDRGNDCFKSCGFFATQCYYFIDNVHYALKGNVKWGNLLARRLASLGWYEPYIPGEGPKITGYSVNSCGDKLNVQLTYDRPINTSTMNAENSRVYIDHYFSVYESRTTTCYEHHPQVNNPDAAKCCLLCAYFGQGANCCIACYVAYPPVPAWDEAYECTTEILQWQDQRETIELAFKYGLDGNRVLVFESSLPLTPSSMPFEPESSEAEYYDFLNITDNSGFVDDGDYFLPAYDTDGIPAERPSITEIPADIGSACP